MDNCRPLEKHPQEEQRKNNCGRNGNRGPSIFFRNRLFTHERPSCHHHRHGGLAFHILRDLSGDEPVKSYLAALAENDKFRTDLVSIP